MDNHAITAKSHILENTLRCEGDIVLTYKAVYPEFHASCYQLSLAAINRYYKDRALAFQAQAEGELYNEAVKLYRFAKEKGYPHIPHEALLDYKLTYCCPCILSLYSDEYLFSGGAHGSTTRSSQTWNLQKCRRVHLEDLISCTGGCQTYVVGQVREQMRKNPEIYFEDYERLAEETFRPEQFYCTHRGIVIYYQQYDVAPYSSGIRKFLLPYSACVSDPQDTCFSVG